jgi:hypothetical protein
LQAHGKLSYRYRLGGLDPDWLQAPQRSVQYANLNDGDYVFEVRAGNEWGHWSAPVKLAFTIQPPFWEKWWFIMSVALALGRGMASVVRLGVRQLLALERLRTRIAADLHDHLGAGLGEIHSGRGRRCGHHFRLVGFNVELAARIAGHVT